MNREQIKEEDIDRILEEVRKRWIGDMAQGDVIPSGGLCCSHHEMAGMSIQRDHAVQASLRIGDSGRMMDSLIDQAVAACHCAASIRDGLAF